MSTSIHSSKTTMTLMVNIFRLYNVLIVLERILIFAYVCGMYFINILINFVQIVLAYMSDERIKLETF